MLDFVWDDDKALSNLARHRVNFAVDIEDRSLDYGEIRRRIVGVASGICLTVIYTERNEIIRIISARKASRTERREYENAT